MLAANDVDVVCAFVDLRAALEWSRRAAAEVEPGLLYHPGCTPKLIGAEEDRVAVLQNATNETLITVDRARSWLLRDSPARAFHLLHPTFATPSLSATAASLMTDSSVMFWNRSSGDLASVRRTAWVSEGIRVPLPLAA